MRGAVRGAGGVGGEAGALDAVGVVSGVRQGAFRVRMGRVLVLVGGTSTRVLRVLDCGLGWVLVLVGVEWLAVGCRP